MLQQTQKKQSSKSFEQNKQKRSEDRVKTFMDEASPQLQQKNETIISLTRIHFSEDLRPTYSMRKPMSLEQHYSKGKSIKQQTTKSLPKLQELRHRKVLVIYASGSSGANENLQIQKGFLKSKIKQNQYLCDEKIMQTFEESQQYLVTPQQENGMRIFYQVEEFSKITPSINMDIEGIKQIADRIYQNYKKYDAFIVLCGFDVICYVATLFSFMLQNLSKLVIFTGGYFPISYMRNDTVNNLNESFSIISFADRFNDVIIVCKNKGYRGNRSIKMIEGSFGSVTSPNIDALISVNIKIKFREYLYLPVPTEEFRIWTNISCRVGIIKFHILLKVQALQYQLSNPAFDGYVIESYGSSNIPQKQQMWEVFKKVAEQKGKIFVNVAQPVKKQNTSMMKETLEKYHIYFGGDMTTEAALCKLSYLLSKKYNRNEIKKLIYTNMRGELTEIKSQVQFQIQHPSFIQLVQQSLVHYYPFNFYKEFINKIENQLALSTQNPDMFEHIFKRLKQRQRGQEIFRSTMVRLIDQNNLLHRAVKASNQKLISYFLNFQIDYNKQDQNECSPLCYAILQKDKKAIQHLLRKGCKIICNEDDLFSSIVKELKLDNVSFFEMLYHVEFKQTLRDVTNYEGRTVLHIASLLKAHKCMRFLLQKFKFNLKQKDCYGKTYADYSMGLK